MWSSNLVWAFHFKSLIVLDRSMMALLRSPGRSGRISSCSLSLQPNIAATSQSVKTQDAPSSQPSPFPCSPAAMMPFIMSQMKVKLRTWVPGLTIFNFCPLLTSYFQMAMRVAYYPDLTSRPPQTLQKQTITQSRPYHSPQRLINSTFVDLDQEYGDWFLPSPSSAILVLEAEYRSLTLFFLQYYTTLKVPRQLCSHTKLGSLKLAEVLEYYPRWQIMQGTKSNTVSMSLVLPLMQ